MRLALITACAVALSASAQAQAQGQTQAGAARARVHFETGTRAFEEGDYSLAILEFEAAYEITQHPDLLFNVYSAAERAGRLEQAELALARYLQVARLRRRQRRGLERRLERLQLRIEEARAQAPPAPAAPEPLPTEPLPPVEHAPGEPSTDSSAAPPPPASGAALHPAGVVSMVVAGALLASFALFATLSELEDQALAGSCGRDVGASCEPDRVRNLEAFNVVADVSLVAGIGAALMGAVLWLVLPAEEGSTVAFAPWATPNGAGGGVVGRW